ncbi:MAG: hypothetical protein EOO70_00420 [Myxococcaceae bacterium]|nr:MAG: hypothetical protein EOO70_00420 [Myxococcaceae bacterium]
MGLAGPREACAFPDTEQGKPFEPEEPIGSELDLRGRHSLRLAFDVLLMKDAERRERLVECETPSREEAANPCLSMLVQLAPQSPESLKQGVKSRAPTVAGEDELLEEQGPARIVLILLFLLPVVR